MLAGDPARIARADRRARPVSAQHVPRHGALVRERFTGARRGEGYDRPGVRPPAFTRRASLYLSALRARGGSRRTTPFSRFMPCARSGRYAIREAALRDHRALRPLSAPQRRSRPRIHRRGIRISEAARVFVLTGKGLHLKITLRPGGEDMTGVERVLALGKEMVGGIEGNEALRMLRGHEYFRGDVDVDDGVARRMHHHERFPHPGDDLAEPLSLDVVQELF